MDNEMKRRVFLSTIIGALIGVPVTIRLLGGKRGSQEEYHFTKNLKKYRRLTDILVTPSSGPNSFSLSLNPPVGTEWKYTVYSPSFLPVELSTAVNNDPDMFFAREGILYVDRTGQEKVVLTGGDTLAGAIAPTGNEEKTKRVVSLLVKDGGLVPAKIQGQPSPADVDRQFVHLLTPNLPPSRSEWSVGMKWKSDLGRIKPFTGVKTEYEITGFAEIADRKCVDLRFVGQIPNMLLLPGVNDRKPEPGAVSSLQYQGHAWFDLETGCLVRQEVHMESVNSGIVGYKGKDGSDTIEIKTDIITQIDHA